MNRATRRTIPETPTPGRRHLAYFRQSARQSDRSGATSYLSFEVQEAACRAAIAQLDPNPASITVITDHVRPGGRGKQRPGRDKIIEMAEAGLVDDVMVYKVSRLGRDLLESVQLYEACQAAGVRVHTSDRMDLSDPAIRGFLMGMAEKENQDRADVSRHLIDNRRSKGLPPVKTGRAFGLRWDGDRLAHDPVEWPAVARIFEAFDAGETMGSIARDLTASRIPRRGRDHCQWTTSAVSQILRCTWYVGLIPDGDGFWHSGQDFLAEIDAGLWDRVKARLGERKRTGQNLDHVLSGLLFCGICGGWSPMSLAYGRHTRKDGTIQTNPRYRCIHRVHDPSFCEGQSITALAVERLILEQLRAIVDGDDLAEARFARRTRAAADQNAEAAEDLQSRIEEVRAKRARLCSQLLDEGFEVDKTWFNETMRSLSQEIVVYEERRERALEKATLSRSGLGRLKAQLLSDAPFSDERWFALPAARRNEFLRLLFPRGLVVAPSSPGTKRGDVKNRIRVRCEEVVDPRGAQLRPSPDQEQATAN